MASGRHYWCPKCRQEYSDYGIKVRREDHPKKTTVRWFGGKREEVPVKIEIPLCPKGHDCEQIPKTKAECPVCHTIGGSLRSDEIDRESGKPFGGWWDRDVNKPCNSCVNRLNQLDRLEKELKTRARGKKPFEVARPYFPSHGRMFDKSKPLEDSYRAILESLGEPTRKTRYQFKEEVTNLPSRDHDRGGDCVMFYGEEEAKALQSLYEEIVKYGDDAFQNGLDRGRSLLTQLAAGEITLQEFNASK